MERGTQFGTAPEVGERLLGESAAWREVLAALPRMAESELSVLILGETGTGKELVARALHDLSARAGKSFVAHNCGATPDSLIESELFGHSRGAFTGAVTDRGGLFEAADGGTLFLDEIGDASPLLQMKLLRVLQEGEARRVGELRVRRVDVRIVSATHRRLEEVIGAGGFRADLYYRLTSVRIELPPLRARGTDVLVLAKAFLARSAARSGLAPPSLDSGLAERLLEHSWPGNVRELANGCAYAMRVGGATEVVGPEHWPPTSPLGTDRVSFGLHAETRALEERRLREALSRARGNKSRAARTLGLSRQGLLKKLRRYGLVGPDEAPETDADFAGEAAALDGAGTGP